MPERGLLPGDGGRFRRRRSSERGQGFVRIQRTHLAEEDPEREGVAAAGRGEASSSRIQVRRMSDGADSGSFQNKVKGSYRLLEIFLLKHDLLGLFYEQIFQKSCFRVLINFF